MKKSIQIKILVFVSILFASIIIIQTVYDFITLKISTTKIIKDHTIVLARDLSADIKTEIEITLENARSVSYTFASIKDKKNPLTINREQGFTILRNVTSGSKYALNAYTLWEPNAFDGKDEEFKNTELYDSTGRFIANVIKDGKGGFIYETPLGYETEDYYLIPINTKKEAIIDPYIYHLNGVDILMISCVVPILYENNVYGEAGMDMKLDFIQLLLKNIKRFDEAMEISIISNNGTFTGNLTDSTLLGKNISEIYSEKECKKIYTLIQNKKEKITTTGGNIIFYVPINFGLSETPWIVRISIAEKFINKAIWKMMIVQLFIGFILLTLSIIILFFLLKKLINPLIKLLKISEELSTGNLNIKIDINQKDEIGQLANSINKVITNFKKVITNIRKSATVVLDASKQLSAVSQQISERSNEQASTTEEISASMQQMLATINSNTENAEITEKTTTKSAKGMQKSEKIFLETINSVSDISEKISIIAEIADKTDMLSINASIEAAHAGEHGKGFAVVSDEIRKLADMTKAASTKIEKLSKSRILISEIAGKNLTKLIPEINKSALLVKNIARASKEQVNGVEAINNSVQQLSDVTNQNSASAEEMSSSAEELSAQAEELKKLISIFQIDEGQKIKQNQTTEIKGKHKIVKKEKNIIEKNNFNFDKSNYDKLDEEFEKY